MFAFLFFFCALGTAPEIARRRFFFSFFIVFYGDSFAATGIQRSVNNKSSDEKNPQYSHKRRGETKRR